MLVKERTRTWSKEKTSWGARSLSGNLMGGGLSVCCLVVHDLCHQLWAMYTSVNTHCTTKSAGLSHPKVVPGKGKVGGCVRYLYSHLEMRAAVQYATAREWPSLMLMRLRLIALAVCSYCWHQLSSKCHKAFECLR